MVADERTLCQNCSNREGRTVFLEGSKYECNSKECGFAKGPEEQRRPQSKKRKPLARKQTKARKQKPNDREEESNEDDDEDLSMTSDQDSDGSCEDPWKIMEISQERWVISNTSPSLTRQYVLRYLRGRLAGHAKFRDADEQDRVDMPPEVLEQWRVTHPFDSIPVTNASRTTKPEVEVKAKTEIAIRVAAYYKDNPQSSSSASTAVPVPQAPSPQAVGTIPLGVPVLPVQRTNSQKQRAWEEENRKTDLDSSNILTTSRRSGT
jgi:hypothetical protein